MTARWVAVIAAWLAQGAMVSTCAIAWGPDGRLAVVMLGAIGLICLTIMTAAVGGTGPTQKRD